MPTPTKNSLSEESGESPMPDPNIADMESTYGLLTNINLILLIAAGIIALLIGIFSVISTRKGIALVKAKDKQAADERAVLNVKAQEAQARAAEANEKAEAERLERTKLEASIAPRVIKVNQDNGRQLDFFLDEKVEIRYVKYDSETIDFAQQVANGLRGWDLTMTPVDQIGELDGVTIYAKQLRVGETKAKHIDAAKIIVFWLKDCGIDVDYYVEIFPDQAQELNWPTNDTILIHIGPKPYSYFTSKAIKQYLERSKEENPELYKGLVETGALDTNVPALGEPWPLNKHEETERARIIEHYGLETGENTQE